MAASFFVAGCNQTGKQDALHLHKLPGIQKPLNMVFILSDDHRHDYMGFLHVVPWLETPYRSLGAGRCIHA